MSEAVTEPGGSETGLDNEAFRVYLTERLLASVERVRNQLGNSDSDAVAAGFSGLNPVRVNRGEYDFAELPIESLRRAQNTLEEVLNSLEVRAAGIAAGPNVWTDTAFEGGLERVTVKPLIHRSAESEIQMGLVQHVTTGDGKIPRRWGVMLWPTLDMAIEALSARAAGEKALAKQFWWRREIGEIGSTALGN